MMKILTAVSILVVFTNTVVAQTTLSPEEIRAVQQNLDDLGYDVGSTNGNLGWKTFVAIGQYQQDWQLPITSMLDAELVERLAGKHPDTMARWQDLENRDCVVWNESPRPRETMTWTGTCENGKASGEGRLETDYITLGKTEGDSYEGAIKAGHLHGKGIYTWFDGTTLEATFVDGLASGSGVYSSGDGVRYEGEFENDRFDGKGVLTFANGNRYTGHFEDGDFSGHGYFRWVDGNSYEGEYSKGEPHGFGVYFSQDVEVLRGTWENGCLRVDNHYSAIGTTRKACGFK